MGRNVTGKNVTLGEMLHRGKCYRGKCYRGICYRVKCVRGKRYTSPAKAFCLLMFNLVRKRMDIGIYCTIFKGRCMEVIQYPYPPLHFS